MRRCQIEVETNLPKNVHQFWFHSWNIVTIFFQVTIFWTPLFNFRLNLPRQWHDHLEVLGHPRHLVVLTSSMSNCSSSSLRTQESLWKTFAASWSFQCAKTPMISFCSAHIHAILKLVDQVEREFTLGSRSKSSSFSVFEQILLSNFELWVHKLSWRQLATFSQLATV